MVNPDGSFGKQRQYQERPSGRQQTPTRPPFTSTNSMPLTTQYGPDPSASVSTPPRRMTRTRSSPTPLQQDMYDDEDVGRDSHDLSISPRAFGRESLVDNLLLSFDKFGSTFDGGMFGRGGADPDDDDAATTSSRHTGYSARGRRSNSSSTQLGGKFVASRPLGSIDYGTMPPPGIGSSYARDPYSQPGMASSSRTETFGTDYDPAPTPTVYNGPRDPRERGFTHDFGQNMERRGSVGSTRSFKKGQAPYVEESMSLPPIPAFHNPTPAPAAPAKQSKPGFLRRMFGGGGSNSSSSSQKPVQPVEIPKEKPMPPIPQQETVATGPAPHQVINKKPSFFRRRKKSVSDGLSSVPPLPNQGGRDDHLSSVDGIDGSPVSSLRAVMNPYLRMPAMATPMAADAEKDNQLTRTTTIRPVQTSDSGTSTRPTYFGESRARRDSETHFAYSSSPYLPKANDYPVDPMPPHPTTATIEPSEPVGNMTPKKEPRSEARPQTGPHAPRITSAFLGEEFRELVRSTQKYASVNDEVEHLEQEPTVQSKPSLAPAPPLDGPIYLEPKPIASVQEIEAQHAQFEQKRKVSRGGQSLNLDVNVDKYRDTHKAGSSWLATPTPHSAGSSITTPTVMLQLDTGSEDADEEATEPESLQAEDEASETEVAFVRKIFEGDEEFVSKARAAAWLGTSSAEAERARKAYLSMFDFSSTNILSALRALCSKLVLKGESQQVDRIIDAFSKRWCECNPNHGFKNADVVHTIVYSVLLLNTDLHMADLTSSQRMTRGQFIKNTMSTIRRGLADLPSTPLEPRPAQSANSTLNARSAATLSAAATQELATNGVQQAGTFPMMSKDKKPVEPRTSIDYGRSSHRNSIRPGAFANLGNLSPRFPDDHSFDNEMDGGLALVNAPLAGGMRVWETQMDVILKDFYNSVKATALPLHGASKEKIDELHTHNNNNLSVFSAGGMLRRSPSTISRAASEQGVGSSRNESSSRLNTKWASKNRSRPKLYNGSFAGSSRTSLDDRSIWSPSASSTWSKYSLDKTQTSMSVTSFGSAFGHGHGDYQQSIGFANALSHAIIREEASGATGDEASSAHLEDDPLELAGAPWAKEGMIKHKHHLEGVEKKAKNRDWTECFAVISKGSLKMFLFNTKSGAKSGGVVGGGNWMDNAQPIGSFLLRQTIASTLPPPGYSKTRPHVWALSLPNGAVHLFQGGTAEIVREWVSTANYWSARLSKEPLIGGVSNVEYGWGDCIVDVDAQSTTATFGPRPSLQESIRSSIDHGAVRPKLPGDKVTIAEWNPPAPSMMASPLNETDQLRALETYVSNIDLELTKHNELRNLVQLAFTPRHPNAAKALANWERKSSYLLREIIKFRTYIDSLSAAIALREKYKEEEKQRQRDNASIISC